MNRYEKGFRNSIDKKSNGTVILIGEYKNTNTKVLLQCLECNHEWNVTPRSYLQNRGICPNCKRLSRLLSQKEVQNRIHNILGKDYTLISKYTGKKDKITIQHSCGYSYQVWSNDIFQKASGKCLSCYPNISQGELRIKEYLDNNNIEYIHEYKIDDFKGERNSHYQFDFYIPKYNLIIEFDGEQHFRPKWGEDENGTEFQRIQKNDKIKNQYCKDNNINLLRIPYTQINKIKPILNKTFNDYRKDTEK